MSCHTIVSWKRPIKSSKYLLLDCHTCTYIRQKKEVFPNSTTNSPPERLQVRPGHRRTFTMKLRRTFSLTGFEDFIESQLSQRKFRIPGLDEDTPEYAQQFQPDTFSVDSRHVKKLSFSDDGELRLYSKRQSLHDNRSKVGNLQTALNVYTAYFGASILVLPSVFAKVGMLGGIAGMTLCAVLNMYILTL